MGIAHKWPFEFFIGLYYGGFAGRRIQSSIHLSIIHLCGQFASPLQVIHHV